MRYQEFERIVSEERMRRYVEACEGDTRKAMTLYHYNIELSQALFAIICHFEVALRNAIDAILQLQLGNEWLKTAATLGGIFDTPSTQKEFNDISKAYNKLLSKTEYSHSQLLASMGFGFWKYCFSPVQYRLLARTLLRVFPDKPRSSAQRQYNNIYIYNELDHVNKLRNRIAHHEPICFVTHQASITTEYARSEYQRMMTLLSWMGIDSEKLVTREDKVEAICKKIEKLSASIKTGPTSLTRVRG